MKTNVRSVIGAAARDRGIPHGQNELYDKPLSGVRLPADPLSPSVPDTHHAPPPSSIPHRLWRSLTPATRRRLRGKKAVLTRKLRRVRWGSFRRKTPLGFNRGTHIDRYYIAAFLDRHASDVHGEVLEVKGTEYTDWLGADRVTHVHVVDVDADNTEATVIADLGIPGALPVERYDCFVCTHTLHLVLNIDAALQNSYDCLRPGGALLITVPGISWQSNFLDPDADLWRFTRAGLERHLQRVLPNAAIEVEAFGNVLAATAFLHGLALEEMKPRDLEHQDVRYHMVVGARVRKPTSN